MTSYTSIVPSYCSSTTQGLTKECLNALMNDDVKKRKSILRMEYEAKMRRFADKSKQTEQRVVDLEKRRKVEKLEKKAKNRERVEKFEKQLDAVNTKNFYKKLELTASLKNRNRQSAKRIAKIREIKMAEKREKLTLRYWTLVEKQYEQSVRYAALIDRCVVNPHLYYKEDEPEMKIEDIEIKEEIEEESFEHCSYVQRAKIPGVDREWSYEDRSFRVKIMERIENIKMNFNTCEQGVAFWEKTAPLWDRMTQCLKNTLVEVSVDESDERRDHDSVSVVYPPLPSLMQEIMMDDVNYNLTDKEMMEVLLLSRTLVGPKATAAELLHLTKQTVLHTAGVKAAATYILDSLIERSIFEFVKREIYKVIFVDMRKAIDRLQYMNDGSIIPDEIVSYDNVDGITMAMYNLIRDDSSYGRLDQPIDDEQKYAEVMAHSAAEKMHEYLRENKLQQYYAMHNPLSEFRIDVTMCPMPRKDELPEIVGNTVRTYLERAHYNTAYFLTTEPMPEPTDSNSQLPKPGKITVEKVIRISRKLTKIAFDMFINDDVKQYNIQKTTDAYQSLVTARVPRMQYDRRVLPFTEEVDHEYFQKLFLSVETESAYTRFGKSDFLLPF